MNTLNLNANYQKLIEAESKEKTHYVQLFLRFYEMHGIRFAASMFKMAQYCPDAIEEMYQYLREHTDIPSIEEYEEHYHDYEWIHSLDHSYQHILRFMYIARHRDEERARIKELFSRHKK